MPKIANDTAIMLIVIVLSSLLRLIFVSASCRKYFNKYARFIVCIRDGNRENGQMLENSMGNLKICQGESVLRFQDLRGMKKFS